MLLVDGYTELCLAIALSSKEQGLPYLIMLPITQEAGFLDISGF